MNAPTTAGVRSASRGLNAIAVWGPRLRFGRVGSYVLLLALAAVYVGPLLMLVNTALKPLPIFMRDAISPATALHFQNFVEAWQKANFPQYLANTILYTLTATVIYVITAVFVAVPIARRYVRGGGFLFVLFVVALFLPPAIIPQFQLMLNLHLYNTQVGYILLFLTNPIGIVILVNYIKSVPKELDEAAALEGCGYLRFVIQIVFPLIKPAIATVAILHSIGIWNELVLATIYLTSKSFYPVTRGLIVFNGVYGNNWPVLAAAVLMIALPMVVFYLFLQRYIIGGVTAGSLRG